MAYRVDTVPWPVRPVYFVAAWICGLALYVYYRICRLTSRIAIEGPGNHDLSQHAIYCLWHESWWSYFVVFRRYRSPHAMMTHPAAYMMPVHVVFRLMGVNPLLLGSSGEEGKQTANAIAHLVQEGYSTTISPDGPHGPARVLKKGVLHMAAQSGVPIVPLSITAFRIVALPTWDSKRIPLPFNRITVTICKQIHVDYEHFDEAADQIVSALSGRVTIGGRDHVASCAAPGAMHVVKSG
jgi:lysophospholipid acyltransferase (LPLAT)-like uncharacterized protein